MDDVYYYFQVARNVSLGSWATFDGIHATSGIQLLWGLILFVVAILFDERTAFLRVTLVLCVFLNVWAGIILRRLGRKLYSVEVGDLATLLWGGFMLGLWPSMMGMEYSLHIVIIIAIIASWWVVFTRDSSVTLWQLFVLGVLLTLNYWTRLDSAIYSFLIWLNVGYILYFKRSSLKAYAAQMTVLSVWPAIGLIGYIVTSYLLAGTFVPISGIVKAHYAGQHFNEYSWLTSLAGHVLWWVRIQCRPMLDILNSILLTSPLFRPLPLCVLVMLLGATFWCVRRTLCNKTTDPKRYRLMMFFGLLWVFGALHGALVVTSIGHFSHVTQHYYGWLMVTWTLWGALLFHQLLSRIKPERSRRFVVKFVLVVFSLVTAGLWQGVPYIRAHLV